jgi:CRISPR-associated endonuclease/helicase Cas3
MTSQNYYSYWGKASPADVGGSKNYHLLVYHALDVAAVGSNLLSLPVFSLDGLAQSLGWSLPQTKNIACFFLAAHDIGKFARSFQSLAPNLSDALVQADTRKIYSQRHDTLGWLLWEFLVEQEQTVFPEMDDAVWEIWIKCCVGHHGKPPRESAGMGDLSMEVQSHFYQEDIVSAQEFLREVSSLMVEKWPAPDRQQRKILKEYSWFLAGIAVLADWLGSNQQIFTYCQQPMALQDYWHTYALPRAQQAVSQAGFSPVKVRQTNTPEKLFDYLHKMTPLQEMVHDLPLEEGPQLFLLEDVTGAGKTEAALILAYRLLSAGRAQGLYFGLPTMATANQMYQRVGDVYQRMYDNSQQVSLVLAHGARRMMDGFSQSIVYGSPDVDGTYANTEKNASAQCNAWLADTQKKALLAHVGVGTLDQALLGVLPVRHQSLRTLGLASKVFIADEVHAFDPYMQSLLEKLLTAHARQGGSAILLSATLPSGMRRRLSQAFQAGLGLVGEDMADDMRYPLLTHVHQKVQGLTCDTREEVRRTVEIAWHHDLNEVFSFITKQSAEGKCVCWIRNTVTDAIDAWEHLQSMQSLELTLFHSRFAIGDRLDIEDTVLSRFGKKSSSVDRKGQILIATQVVEQSLDLDFDVLITDLAPIDLLIQRAGRLHRHVRDVQGNIAQTEGRSRPILQIVAPQYADLPDQLWYDAMFPRATYVYPDTGKLWLTQRSLMQAGKIVSPGKGESGSVRQLIESVYGPEAIAIPDALQMKAQKSEGQQSAHRSTANFNALKMEKGYCYSSSAHWYEDSEVPTRLGEETVQIYLARCDKEKLTPWIQSDQFAWEQSSLRINAERIKGLSEQWDKQFGGPLQALRDSVRLLEYALIIPLVWDSNGQWTAEVLTKGGKVAVARYDVKVGFIL